MNTTELARYNFLYEQHLTNLSLQGKRPATIDAYSRAVRRISAFFDCPPDHLTTEQLRTYFRQLIRTHSWSTVKLDRNGLQFFYRYTLSKQWIWLNIVKPPQVKRLPDLLVRLLDTLAQHPTLRLPPAPLPTEWVVDCRKVGRGLPTLQYLSRYLYRSVLPDKDIITFNDHQVTFRYTDSQTQRPATRTLPVVQFLWLILQHVLPKGLQRVRDYGLLHGSAKALRLTIQLMLLSLPTWQLPEQAKPQKAKRDCPCCQHAMCCVGATRPR
ncbi:transposase [Thaumasiovibrio sp. DFM-14]|uniref:transposase n=1 Tax=Thaumasiovibrio sp. DFM-14 TaxID=3384792 RepID=UPI0039A0EB2C